MFQPVSRKGRSRSCFRLTRCANAKSQFQEAVPCQRLFISSAQAVKQQTPCLAAQVDHGHSQRCQPENRGGRIVVASGHCDGLRNVDTAFLQGLKDSKGGKIIARHECIRFPFASLQVVENSGSSALHGHVRLDGFALKTRVIGDELVEGAKPLNGIVNVVRTGNVGEALVLLINEVPHQLVDALVIIHGDAVDAFPSLSKPLRAALTKDNRNVVRPDAF